MDTDRAYQETLDYLYSYIDYSLQKTFRYSPEKFDLERMRGFMALLGEPQLDYPVIHIAGTKGKGSVAALCASALQASGNRIGLYTSPHLQDYAERIQVDGEPILHADLIALVEEIKPLVHEIPGITTFELTTALAFLHFSRQDVDVGVLEVGLGGRLDATNVCQPQVTVITSISYDHTYLLGETLAEIAGEKAGIIKPGIPLVVSPQAEHALAEIERIAAERMAPLIQVGRDYKFEALDGSIEGQAFQVWRAVDGSHSDIDTTDGEGNEGQPVELRIPLLGYHQVENAATAYAALQVARKNGIMVTERGIQRGLQSVHWPGRFEILRRDPPVVIDSAHNRDSAQKLHRTLEEYFPGYPVVLVFGASEDKDIQGMLAELLPRVRQVVATKSAHPRAIEPGKLADMIAENDLPVVSSPSVEEALDAADALAQDGAAIVVAGSIFIAAAARAAWKEVAEENYPSYTGI
jgi:dihydrofolate synthase/folylpolyglutamate synthase